MDLDREHCYRIIQARDARYDGRLFVGVRTTGVYCRPVCPARTPKRSNVTFFASAAAAHDAGFRPCLRCRPEVAPDLAAWNGSSSTVTRALRLIDAGSPGEPAVDRLAARLGLGSRQLRRLFVRHVGASPGAVLRTRRVHLARQLIQDTSLPIADVAYAAGFGSLRRFNETFRDLFGRPPSALRRSDAVGTADPASLAGDVRHGFMVRLAYAPPFAWDEALAFFAARAIPGVEAVSDNSYARSLTIDGTHAVIAVSLGRAGTLALRVHAPRLHGLASIVGRVRGMFDLGADPGVVDAHLSADPWLAPLVAARPGLRVPGAWDGFELAVRAVLGQQITVRAATGLAGRLVTRCGEPLDAALQGLYPGVTHVFPTPAVLGETALTAFGMPGARVAALRSLARAVHADATLLTQHASLDDSVRALTALDGIGEWTAQYIAMRELREPDAFPAADAGLLRAAAALAGRRLSSAALIDRAEQWRPWRAYGAMHLWTALGAGIRPQILEETHVA